ncbi:hypothetical protein LXL04_000419 [Taraxacum kok-saghyz]
MSLTQTSTDKVSETSCSPACIAKYKSCREQVDLLIREIEDLRYDGYTLRKAIKQQALENKTTDYERVLNELVELKNNELPLAKYNINRLTAELAASNARFKNAEFNFKKFDVSSEKVEVMIENQMKWQDKQGEGLGYSAVPPPFDNNYTPVLEPIVLRRPPPGSQPSVPVLVKTETPKQVDQEKVNESNASTSCAEEVLVEDWDEEDENVSSSSNTNSLSPDVSNNCVSQDTKTVSSGSSKTDGDTALNVKSNTPTVEKYKPKKFVRQSDKCTCTCGNSGKQKQIPKRDPQTSQRQGPSPNGVVLKRQTCFSCGIAGHIARNCPNPPLVPVHAHHLKNISKGDSFKRKSSRSCSNDSDWRANKTRTKDVLNLKSVLKNLVELIHVRKSGPREECAKPKMVRQKPSHRQPINHHSKQKPTKKGKTNVSSSMVQPTRLDKRPKPVYRWVAKVPAYKSSNHPVITLSFVFNKQDMVWEREQQRRNIFRPWFVDSGCSTHMRGDISNRLVILIINDRYVSLAGSEKGKITNGDRNKRCTKNGNFILELIRFDLMHYSSGGEENSLVEGEKGESSVYWEQLTLYLLIDFRLKLHYLARSSMLLIYTNQEYRSNPFMSKI